MQLIAEAYDILKRGLGISEDEIADIFTKWNKGVLDSFLIEITSNILKFKDEDGEPMVTKILDQAGQKGTGKWTAVAALDAGMPGESSSTFYDGQPSDNALSQSRLSARLFSLVACLQSSPRGHVQARSSLVPRRSRSRVTSSNSSTTSSRRFTRQRSFLTPRASCSCVRPRKR